MEGRWGAGMHPPPPSIHPSIHPSTAAAAGMKHKRHSYSVAVLFNCWNVTLKHRAGLNPPPLGLILNYSRFNDVRSFSLGFLDFTWIFTLVAVWQRRTPFHSSIQIEHFNSSISKNHFKFNWINCYKSIELN